MTFSDNFYPVPCERKGVSAFLAPFSTRSGDSCERGVDLKVISSSFCVTAYIYHLNIQICKLPCQSRNGLVTLIIQKIQHRADAMGLYFTFIGLENIQASYDITAPSISTLVCKSSTILNIQQNVC